jgi:hypothetical protein
VNIVGFGELFGQENRHFSFRQVKKQDPQRITVWENPIYTFEVCKFDDIATSLTKLVSGPNSLRAMILYGLTEVGGYLLPPV